NTNGNEQYFPYIHLDEINLMEEVFHIFQYVIILGKSLKKDECSNNKNESELSD
ncbi:21079_t:CDS:2, partial [Gigaspora rosea]